MATHYGKFIMAPFVALIGLGVSALHNRQFQKSSKDFVELDAAAASDTVELFQIRSDAVMSDLSEIKFDAFGSARTIDIGFKTDAAAGISAKTDALVDGESVATAGTVKMLKAVDLAKKYQPLWQVLGLAKDPGGNFTVIATLLGGTFTGTLAWEAEYTSY